MDHSAAKNPLIQAIARLHELSRPALVGMTFAILIVVALVDYLTGYEIS
jgi:hypothetical protein